MFLFSVQTILLIAAGVGLFWLWRAAVPSERWLTLAVAAGFLARAIFGQALFWISWARLPMARSLQLGDGFWVFAQDARWYVSEATRVAHTGPWAIVMYDRGAASVMYEQLLATFIWLFGSAVSVALLINLFSYLGTVAILVQWSRRQPRTATAAALAIVAIAFSPAFVLWALQPLKDPFFQFLFVAFVAACAAWQRAWVGPGRWAARLGTAALLVALIFALAGIRWYFAAVLVAAASLFMLLVVFQSAERRLVSLGAAVVVALLLSWSLAISAAPYLSGRLRAFLNPRTTLQTMKTAPASILGSVEQARKGFDQTAASTVIRTGDRLKTKSAPAPAVQVVNVVTERPKPQPRPQAKPQPKPAAPPAAPQPKAVALAEQPAATPLAVAPPAPTPVADLAPPKATLKVLSESELPAADAADVRAVLEAEVAAWNRRDMQNFVSWWWMSPKFELQHGDTVVHGPEKVTEYLSKTYGNKDSPGQVAMADLRMTGTPGDTALVRGTWTVTVPDQTPFTGRLKVLLRRFPEGWKVVRLRLPRSAEPAFPAAAEPEMVEVEPPAPQQVAHVEKPPPAPQQVAHIEKPPPAPQPPIEHAAQPPVSHRPPARPAPRPAAAPARPAPTPPPTAAPAPPSPPPPAFTDADAAQIRGVLAAQAAAWNRNDLDGYMATYSRAPELADDTTVVRGWRPVVDYYRTNYTREGGLGTLTFSSVSIVGAANGTTASISGRCKLTAGDGDGRNGDFAMQLQRLPEGWKVVRTTIPASHTDERETQSRGVRFLTGAAVLVLPRSAGEWLGIFHIRGGRGMMWFAELDTIVFDLVLLCALLALAARSSAPWRNPLTWLVLLITLVIGGLLAYSVSNFGTLFRLREMIYVGLFLVPLAVANQAERSASLRDPRTRHHPV